MPKLDRTKQQSVEQTPDDGGFPLLPEGRYVGTLAEVEVRQGTEYEYWECTFKQLTDADGKAWKGRAWDNVSMSPDSEWKVKQFFNAMGYSLDSDTDEMIGDQCVLVIGQQIAERGKRKGQTVNYVIELQPYEADEWEGNAGGAASQRDDDF